MALRQHGEDDITLMLARIRQAKSARQPGEDCSLRESFVFHRFFPSRNNEIAFSMRRCLVSVVFAPLMLSAW